MVRTAGRGTQDYCDWWRDHDTLGLFDVRLTGDVSSPRLFTPMAQNDLAYCRCATIFQLHVVHCCTTEEMICNICACSKWGHNRVLEHQASKKPINLVIPVLTRADVVQQAVAGTLSGQISLSMLNVEALLVLANAVGVS